MWRPWRGLSYFNPRSPHGERHKNPDGCTLVSIFQSTLPAWGATYILSFVVHHHIISIHAPRMGSDIFRSTLRHISGYFNPRSPHGERQKLHVLLHGAIQFQSTLPAWGATLSMVKLFSVFSRFQSTLPAWGATEVPPIISVRYYISIHAPRMGSDTSLRRVLMRSSDFNPRSPHGERQVLRGKRHGREEISIHAPCMGSDR